MRSNEKPIPFRQHLRATGFSKRMKEKKNYKSSNVKLLLMQRV